MAIVQRSRRGTFATELPRDERAIITIIELVAEIAADWYDKLPVRVTQAEWNACRHLLEGYGEIPRIHGLLAQLPDRHGKPYSYRALLRDIFDEDRSTEHVTRERVTVEDWPDLDKGHIDFGLNIVADYHSVTSFSPARYDVLRDEVIRAERRRKHLRDLERQIPTSDQIIRVYEDWNAALVAHGLEPQPKQLYSTRGVRLADAIVRFYVKTGYLR